MSDERAHDGTPIALEQRASQQNRLSSPSAARNRQVIGDTFLAHMPHQGRILEIASGTGEHAIHICKALPDLTWQPSDPDPASRASINAWRHHEALDDRIEAAMELSVEDEHWPKKTAPPYVGLLCINMIHIAPFSAAQGLLAGAGAVLGAAGRLFLYGPFKRKGDCAPSNHDFDSRLKSRHPAWGVRDLDLEVIPLARQAGFQLVQIIDMPANNLSVVFEKN
ncbi:MAG: DUF938 domain-containing protein [bacterium]